VKVDDAITVYCDRVGGKWNDETQRQGKDKIKGRSERRTDNT